MGLTCFEGWPSQCRAAATRPGHRRLGTTTAATVDPKTAIPTFESLKKRLITTVVVQAQKCPAGRDQESRNRPANVSGASVPGPVSQA